MVCLYANHSKSVTLMIIRRTLDSRQKVAYTQAVRCLQRLPTRNTTSPQAATRFDELQAIHIILADGIHAVVSDSGIPTALRC